MAKRPNDDLFEGTTMSFGEHLEELRSSLFKAVVGIALGCVVGFFMADYVVRFFQSPLEKAMERHYIDRALGNLKNEFGVVPYEIRRLILDEKLIPEPLHIDAARLSDTLKFTYPERFSGLVISPYWITEGDLLLSTANQIAVELRAAGKSKSASPARRMWELLTPEQHKTVERLAGVTGTYSLRQVSELLAILNDLAGKPELHDADELKGLIGPDAVTVTEIRTALATKGDPEQSRRLNKLLIASVFGQSMRAARVNLLSLFAWKPVNIKFQVLNAQEAFMIWLKAALTTGIVVASPYVFYQVWVFVAAGLYPHEKNYVYLYMPISILLFFGGASLAFTFVFQPVLDFLFLFNKGMNAEFEPRIGEWLSFVLILPLGFGLSFQLPLVMLFINRIGLVSVATYINQWRVAILTIFVVAMILTPADPISMLLMAGPLCGLYVLGILMCKYMPRGRNRFDTAYEP